MTHPEDDGYNTNPKQGDPFVKAVKAAWRWVKSLLNGER